MTNDEYEEFLQTHSKIYHLAGVGSWEKIFRNGLMSTTALLNFYGKTGEERRKLESERRDESEELEEGVTIRDQHTMGEEVLREECLPKHITPQDWYRFLNKKVFFWPTEPQLRRMANSEFYRYKMNEVLVIDTQELIEAYWDKVSLSPINSGFAFNKRKRDYDTFVSIDECPINEHPWSSKGVVELCVDGAIKDIGRFVLEVFVMHKGERGKTLYPRCKPHSLRQKKKKT